jgi:membrane-bound ClpP family serine protease
VLLGLVLLALEIFVIPGFGMAGITGIVMILLGLVMTFVGNTPGLPGGWRLPQFWGGVQTGLLVVVGGMVSSVLVCVWLRRYLPKLPYFNRLILTATTGGPGPTVAGMPGGVGDPADTWPFVGTVGKAVSDLRPGGSVSFPYADDTRVMDVVSDTGFVRSGTKVAVREVRGSYVVVRPLT